LRELVIVDLVATENAVHPNAVVKVVSGEVASNFVNVVGSEESTYTVYFSSGKTLQVKPLGREKVREVGPKIVEKVESVGRNEDTILLTIVQNDDGCGQNVLVSIVALRIPPLWRGWNSVSKAQR
jgi:hypothetical protein